MSIFNENNMLFLRNPEGGVEDIQLMKNAGFNIIACNVQKEIPVDKWNTVRARSAQAGAISLPWCYIWNLGDLDRLLTIADDWSNGRCVVNIEKEIDVGTFSPEAVATKVGNRDVAYSLVAWLYNAVNWYPLTSKPAMLQIFPYEIPVSAEWEACVEHAHDMGFSCVSMTFGTYDVAGVGQPQPEDYPLKTPYQLYTADDLTYCYPHYEIWGPTGTYEPCETKLEPIPENLCPYTGPYYYAGQKYKRIRGKTVKALKIAMRNMKRGAFLNPTTYYGIVLKNAMFKWQADVGILPTGNYGKLSWAALRSAVGVDGKHALDAECLKLIQEDYNEAN